MCHNAHSITLSERIYQILFYHQTTTNCLNTETNGIGHKSWSESKYTLMGWSGSDVSAIWGVGASYMVRIQLGCKSMPTNLLLI